MITIEKETVWCKFHLAIADRKGVDSLKAAFAIFDVVFEKPEVKSASMFYQVNGKPEEVEKWLLTKAPFCDYIGDDELAEIYKKFQTKFNYLNG